MPKKSAPKKDQTPLTPEEARADLVKKAKKAGEINQKDIT
ncbi:MAG: hypothetical protein QG628_309, partial [Patescibacteria group bacterium]|nr:hypothetical protein [Patescibacteria group bacterium]